MLVDKKTFKYRCSRCKHLAQEDMTDVQCCNVCGEDIFGEETVEDCFEDAGKQIIGGERL